MSIHDGKVALVTGGASGIGHAMAELLVRGGAKVVIADVNEAHAKEAAQELGGDALALGVDVSDEASVEGMVGATVQHFGRLDYAFNNAGISDRPNRIVDFDLAAWDRMIAVNMTGVFLCMKHEIRQFLTQDLVDERRGAICNTSSGAGIIPAPGQPHYTAAKHGVLGITKLGAQEYAAEGVRVNAICPGLTDTPMAAQAMPEELFQQVLKTMPGGKVGRPVDVAAAAVWLCSDEARWVNGQGLVVDGGGVVR
jgi:NAD(P)-dependent dehydrogenase (short-subunit alcohol dehydrogenase family)